MSECCREPDCRRKTPLQIYLADFSKTVYVVTRSKVAWHKDDGTPVWEAQERHDMTEAVRFFIRANPEWVRDQLAEAQESAAKDGARG